MTLVSLLVWLIHRAYNFGFFFFFFTFILAHYCTSLSLLAMTNDKWVWISQDFKFRLWYMRFSLIFFYHFFLLFKTFYFYTLSIVSLQTHFQFYLNMSWHAITRPSRKNDKTFHHLKSLRWFFTLKQPHHMVLDRGVYSSYQVRSGV